MLTGQRSEKPPIMDSFAQVFSLEEIRENIFLRVSAQDRIHAAKVWPDAFRRQTSRFGTFCRQELCQRNLLLSDEDAAPQRCDIYTVKSTNTTRGSALIARTF